MGGDPRVAALQRDIQRLRRDHPEFSGIARPVPVAVLEPGFPGLIQLILGQQVSIEAADAMYRRLVATVGTVDPQAIRTLDESTMRSCGFTRLKAEYARGIADAVQDGFDLDEVGRSDPDDAIEALTALRGIGRWTAECYLLFSVGHRDVFPAGDMALQRGWQEITGTSESPSEHDLREVAERWAPRRSGAAHLIWHGYLRSRGRR